MLVKLSISPPLVWPVIDVGEFILWKEKEKGKKEIRENQD